MMGSWGLWIRDGVQRGGFFAGMERAVEAYLRGRGFAVSQPGEEGVERSK